ncbi:hypothetical protein HNQ79_006681 [Streptomyces candidus]|uniref:Transposase n=1 Tax=Streptomyces candidus TaxID=67283 RepID=A0A7X0HPU2_9ACTN|nr:hypothetical protein [Streptomyces candidus]GHH56009.1 hypothetical protein GCM10018773_61250 [Streptomyces candidus]
MQALALPYEVHPANPIEELGHPRTVKTATSASKWLVLAVLDLADSRLSRAMRER